MILWILMLSVSWKSIDFPEVHTPSSSGSQNKQHTESCACHLFIAGFLFAFSTLKVEAICSSETSTDIYQTTGRYNTEHFTFLSHQRENLNP
jgi:hypothetical protein